MRPPAPRSVLFVIGSLERGGAEQQMTMLARKLAARGISCTVFALDGAGPMRPALDAAGVDVCAMGYLGRPFAVRAAIVLASPLYLWWVAVHRRPDVLHAYLPFTNFIGSLAGRLARVPAVITSRRGLGTHQDRLAVWKFVDRWSNALSDLVTCNSEAVVADTIRRDGIAASKVRLVRNGLELASFDSAAERTRRRAELGLDESTRAIVTVANLIPYKGHADLLDALGRLPPGLPPFRLFLAGRDAGIGGELSRQADGLGLGSRVVFLGERRDVPQLLAAMDVFVLPSHEEGSSNALIEAMAAGLTLIATGVGGNTEALDGGSLGRLVPPRDPDALSRALADVLRASDPGKPPDEALMAHAQRTYSADALTDASLALYREVLGPTRR